MSELNKDKKDKGGRPKTMTKPIVRIVFRLTEDELEELYSLIPSDTEMRGIFFLNLARFHRDTIVQQEE